MTCDGDAPHRPVGPGPHARWETRLLLRNGEQVLLTLVIPVGIMLGLTLTDVFAQSDGDDRTARALATVLAVSVISAAFTSLAIATAFERRSGALRFLGTTPLTRTGAAGGQGARHARHDGAVGCRGVRSRRWRWAGGPALACGGCAPVIVLGTAVFAAWGMSLAGLLRAEAVLAVANGIFLFLLMFGGVVIPAASLPGPLADAGAVAALGSARRGAHVRPRRWPCPRAGHRSPCCSPGGPRGPPSLPGRSAGRRVGSVTDTLTATPRDHPERTLAHGDPRRSTWPTSWPRPASS